MGLDKIIQILTAGLLKGHNAITVKLRGIQNLLTLAGITMNAITLIMPRLKHRITPYTCWKQYLTEHRGKHQ